MKKTRVLSLTVFIMLVFCFGSCYNKFGNKLTYDYTPVKYFEEQYLFLNPSETVRLDINQIFKYSGINISSYELTSNNKTVATVDKDVITAHGAGQATISYTLYDKSAKKRSNATVAYVHVINEADMTPITTAEELAAINDDLNGNYILKADIDLANWGEWVPIGVALNSVFKGIFANKGGYKIKNLTISPSGVNDTVDGGLFGTSFGYIDGIILENVNINLLMCESSNPQAGGIARSSWGTVANCSVRGEISTKLLTGGICGDNYGKIINCNFEGTLNTVNTVDDPNASAGGIAAYSYPYGLIKNCNAKGNISSTWIAGGILGYTDEPDQNISRVKDCSFDLDNYKSSITAPIPGWIIGWRKDRSHFLNLR